MPEPIEKEIGGITFVLTPFGARRGLSILTRLLKLVDLSELDKSSVSSLQDGSSDVLLELLAAVQRTINPALLDEFLDEFEKACRWKNETGQLLPMHRVGEVHHADRIFSQNYAAWFKWVGWILQENFSSFFPTKPETENQ